MATSAGKKLSAFAVYREMEREAARDTVTVNEEGLKPYVETTITASKKATSDGPERKKKKKRKLSLDEVDAEETGMEMKQSVTKRRRLAKLKRILKSKAKRSDASQLSASPFKLADNEDQLQSSESESDSPEEHVVETSSEELSHQESNDETLLKPTCMSMKGEGADLSFYDQFDSGKYSDSRVAARELFKLLISPLSLEQFYEEVWEKKPLLLRRHKPQYNAGWFSTSQLDSMLRTHNLEFTTNVDVTSYVDGVKTVHNPSGRAHASVVWDYFKEGCSVRVLNPQSYSKPMWLLNSTLQEHFKSMVGANAYLTPPGSQGFAPHYDDIEAFVLQLEGKKHWRLYSPKSSNEVLPRYSSPNFSEDEIGEPILDVVLEEGDLLYFPRGIIHQAVTPPDDHSLHITVSTYQNNLWGTLLEKLLPAALQTAISEDVDFRRGLPLSYLDYTGIVNTESDDSRRAVFLETVANLLSRLIHYAPIDAAVDQMGVDHIHDCLPPCINQKEEQASLHGNGARWEGGEIKEGVELTPDTKVKLIRHGVVRLVLEGDQTMLYYTLQNSKVYHEKEVIGMDMLDDDAVAVEHLISCYPKFVPISSLPTTNGSFEENVELCNTLYNQGLLLVKI